VQTFEVLGGVPAGKIRYDNLKAAVAQVIGFSRQRVEADRWVAFRSHFDIDAFYCQPGVTGAHEKGGIEGDIGRFRRNHLVPVPEVDSLRELNDLIDEYDRADDARRPSSSASRCSRVNSDSTDRSDCASSSVMKLMNLQSCRRLHR
jgi:hypothetical protein